jgi:hypothetical protein
MKMKNYLSISLSPFRFVTTALIVHLDETEKTRNERKVDQYFCVISLKSSDVLFR